jgi:RNA polymerase sporulation-specific sigma factor
MLYEIISFLMSNLMFLALHISSASSFPKPLCKKEEEECLRKIKQGDTAARDKLIEHNLRLVAHVTKKYYTPNCEQSDLISIGTIGLIKAVNSFDCDKGIRFSTYAARCIENELLMHYRALKKSSLDVSLSDSIDVDRDGNSLTFSDVLAVDDTLVDDIEFKIKSSRLYDLVESVLDEREREIIILRYGLYGEKPLTQREVAVKLKISRSYVSRIEKKALGELKENFNPHLNG